MNPNCLSPEGVAQIGCITSLFGRIVNLVAAFAGVVFFIMLLVGGFRYLFSAGDAKQTEAAKGTLTAALLGLILIVASYVILRLIASFTGLQNLTIFNLTNITP